MDAAPDRVVRQVERANTFPPDKILCGPDCGWLVERYAEHDWLGGCSRKGSRWLHDVRVCHQGPCSVGGKAIGDPRVHTFDMVPGTTGARPAVRPAQQLISPPAVHPRGPPLLTIGITGRASLTPA